MDSCFTTKRIQWTVAILLGIAAVAPAFAQSPAQGLLDNPFVFSAGMFVVGTDIKASLNGQSANNPEVDFDQTLGTTNDATRGRVDVLWRINPKHHLRFMYFNNSNSRANVIDQDFNWGDNTFKAGGNVDTQVKMEVYNLAYEYAFIREPSYEVAASLGAHVMDMSIQMAGQATLTDASGGVSLTAFKSRVDSVTAPLPVIGVRGGWAIAPQWYIDAQAQLFNIEYDAYDGTWSDVRIGATWMFHNNVGVGLGYNRFATRVDVDKTGFDGRLKIGYSGLQAYLTGTF
ncbi:MAG: hypothetical protein V7707_19875 [Motiliproteus sp.]